MLELQLTTSTCSCENEVSGIASNVTAFCQLTWETNPNVFNAGEWTAIIWDSMNYSKNMEYNDASGVITFAYSGIYEITISFSDIDFKILPVNFCNSKSKIHKYHTNYNFMYDVIIKIHMDGGKWDSIEKIIIDKFSITFKPKDSNTKKKEKLCK